MRMKFCILAHEKIFCGLPVVRGVSSSQRGGNIFLCALSMRCGDAEDGMRFCSRTTGSIESGEYIYIFCVARSGTERGGFEGNYFGRVPAWRKRHFVSTLVQF
ncbi:hypothetical protein TRVL_08371 [Trypanosoma vivax]|nr:hypothetical protein TRVL_08371 [Trypanosoma vivax]